jgi:hypothetical protein
MYWFQLCVFFTVLVDNWIVHEVIQANYRDVIDGSEAAVVARKFHFNCGFVGAHISDVIHNYLTADGKTASVKPGETFWQKSKAKSSNWMVRVYSIPSIENTNA